MKNIQLLLVMLSVFTLINPFAQNKNLRPKKRSDVFGKPTDYKDYTYYGLMFSGGLNHTLTRSDAANILYRTTVESRPIEYLIDPEGKPGYFLEAGMAHIPQKSSKLAKLLKTVLISYYDWGIGYRKINGYESTTITRYGPNNSILGTSFGEGTFSNGYVYGRFSIHQNIHFTKKYFLDNALGLNFDYRISASNKSAYEYAAPGANTVFQRPFAAQLHYGLGFGIRPSRRSFWVIGSQIPILGFYEWRNGGAAIKWFDSNYVPLNVQLKWVYLFKKKTNGCNTPGTEEDERRNKEYMQNN